MIHLGKRQILKLHANLIEVSGGDSSLRDESLLDAALAAPFHSYDDVELFPSVQEKAARLGFGLC